MASYALVLETRRLTQQKYAIVAYSHAAVSHAKALPAVRMKERMANLAILNEYSTINSF